MAYNSIIQRVKEGGLQLMDLEARIQTNLLSWVVRSPETPNLLREKLSKGSWRKTTSILYLVPSSIHPNVWLDSHRSTWRSSGRGLRFTTSRLAMKLEFGQSSYGTTCSFLSRGNCSPQANDRLGRRLAYFRFMTYVMPQRTECSVTER